MSGVAPVHAESRFEEEIVEVLQATGWTKGDSAHYDKLTAIYPAELEAFLRATQATEMQDLASAGVDARELPRRVRAAVDALGLSRALLYGVDIAGVHLTLMYVRPAHQATLVAERLYQANRLMVVQQLEYSNRNGNRLDLGLFLNGLPIATAELKSVYTQSAQSARDQYRADRNPAGEPLLASGTGALVHFALDQVEASMATKLEGPSTRFLPLNRYSESGERNPLPGGVLDHPTFHVWRQLWQRDNLLEILARFVTQEPDPDGVKRPHDRVLFPRFHQWEASRAVVQDVREHGAGRKYLIQHSPGSGKSNTIGWTGYALSELHRNEEKLFSSVLLLTDRIVLRDQTDGTARLLRRFDGTYQEAKSTSHLVRLLLQGCPVIVSTIQRFAHVFSAKLSEHDQARWKGIKNRRFAVLIDEAHSSQDGELHGALRRHLETSQRDNVTYVAFTATPREETLALFGTADDAGRKRPFHLYSMGQALREGFILNVLQNYYPVSSAYCLVVNGKDVLLNASDAARLQLAAIARDPTAIAEKVSIIVPHFHERVAASLSGRAKAMVVVDGRLAALRYYRAIREYLREHRLPYGCLVAFSDAVPEPLEDGAKYYEWQANGLSEGADIAQAFKEPQQRFLVVADKYQTGFDQPLLNAMYLDKPLTGDITAVQTLSRLNRLYPGKEAPFVLDFVNDPEAVRSSFERYQGKLELERYAGIEVLEQLAEVLSGYRVYPVDLVEDLAGELLRGRERSTARVEALVAAIERTLRERGSPLAREFKSVNGRFVTQYSLASKVDQQPRPWLTKLFCVARLVQKVVRIPTDPPEGGEEPAGVEAISVVLARLTLEEPRALELPVKDPVVGTQLPGGTVGPVVSPGDREKHQLSQFVQAANAELLRGDVAALTRLLLAGVEVLAKDSELAEQARSNTFDAFASGKVRARFNLLLAQRMRSSDSDEAAWAAELQRNTADARALKEKASRAVAHCVYNRVAAFSIDPEPD